MSNLKIFCVTNKKTSHLEGSSLLLASVGKEKFNKNYLKSNIQDNIFHKEKLINFFYKSLEICFSSSIQSQ